jgi:hypothetical protein
MIDHVLFADCLSGAVYQPVGGVNIMTRCTVGWHRHAFMVLGLCSIARLQASIAAEMRDPAGSASADNDD